MSKLIHAKLTYKVRGGLMAVHYDLKPMLPERFYQEAAEIIFQEVNVPFEAQKHFEVLYGEERVAAIPVMGKMFRCSRDFHIAQPVLRNIMYAIWKSRLQNGNC